MGVGRGRREDRMKGVEEGRSGEEGGEEGG